MRETFVAELLLGTLDKFGNTHDDEKRALILTLDTILGFVPMLESQFQSLEKRKKQQEDRAATASGIHGDENVYPRGTSWSDSQMY